MLGWDDVAEHRPFDPLTSIAPDALSPWQFPPFGSARRTVGTHVYDFFSKSYHSLAGRASQ